MVVRAPCPLLQWGSPHVTDPQHKNPNMDVRGKTSLMGEDLDPGLMGMIKENGYEGRCGSDQFEGASSDDEDGRSGKQKRKKKYHRHTPYQIKELEDYFNNGGYHPNENQRFELGKKLSLDSKQVKFWFQNRRTQLKTQVERYQNSILKRQMEQLVIENIRMKEAIRNPICNNCGGPAILGDISIEERHFRVENARLKDELTRVNTVAYKFLGRPISSIAFPIPSPVSNSSLELAVGLHGFSDLSSVDTTFSMGVDSNDGFLNALPMVSMPSTTTVGMGGVDIHLEKPVFLELGLHAMDELIKLAQIDNPLWVQSLDGGREVLNQEEYMRICPPCTGMKPRDFVTEATRATGSVVINSLALVETLMDVNQWTEMFPCMVGRASVDVIFSGMAGSRDCALQLMYAEFQALSPLVPVRPIKFLRFCKQPTEGVWAIVDVSVEGILELSDARPFVNCRRLPSGCIVQDLPNGSSKVTWVEHSEFDESVVHHLYHPFISSGMGFGAHRWLSTLQRQSECLAVLVSSSISTEDHSGITQVGRSSMVKLAQRMTRNFSAGVCGTMHTWQLVQVGSVGEHLRLMVRNSIGNSGEPPGIVLSATTSVSMPISPQSLFDFLRNEQLRSEWDELSHGGPMQEMVHIPKGQDRANCVSLLRPSAANTNQNTMLILQEMQTDASGSLIVYTAVDIPAMQVVMSGGDSATVAFLPSGFAIIPDSAGSSNCNGTVVQERGSGGSGGSLLTVGFQILVDNSPTAKLTMESVDTVNNLIGRTIQRIKAALNCAV
ncbi:homeobox-leucine zipper protein ANTHOCYANINLESS 2-like isoform X1 [Rhododendron vialii]|uniref:homeobox-leucine zipper protein ANTHOCYANINLESS 2-like isoform X1 n=2 Tax=Rhododendron vialii TaxID=182163 RepID=UPI00265D9493|nr:homeobox-leucine zipper protein ANTHOCYANINLESS 2-like isoform X1 [Rhododendron vialii]